VQSIASAAPSQSLLHQGTRENEEVRAALTSRRGLNPRSTTALEKTSPASPRYAAQRLNPFSIRALEKTGKHYRVCPEEGLNPFSIRALEKTVFAGKRPHRFGLNPFSIRALEKTNYYGRNENAECVLIPSPSGHSRKHDENASAILALS